MRRLMNISLALVSLVSLVLLASTMSLAQKLPKKIYIQAQATLGYDVAY